MPQVTVRFNEMIEVPMHRHREATLVATLAGSTTMSTPAETFALPPRSLLWVAGDTPHGATTSRDHRSLILTFAPSLVSRPTGRLDGSGFLHDLLARLIDTADTARRDRLTAVIVDELAAPLPADARLAQITALLAARPAIPVSAIAAHVGMSERSLRRWFHAELGTSFTAWNHRRICDRAITALHRGASVKAIAAAQGYASPSAFIAMFKRVTGAPPLAFRQSVG